MDKRIIIGPFASDFLKGGPGSGNHGHAGRPGERGGSGEGGGEAKVDPDFIKYGIENKAEKDFDRLSFSELEAIDSYTTSLSYRINAKLRANPNEIDAEAKLIASSIDKAAEFEKEIPLYRGLNPRTSPEFDNERVINFFKENVGKTVQMAGFQSATIDPNSATLANFSRNNGVVMEIKTKKGLAIAGKSQSKGEKEVLLGHNWKYKVLGITQKTFKTDNGPFKRTVIRMEVA